jgi:sulfite exporter TauE/SafE
MYIWTAFILGLVGSLHCAGMCGPLALALPTPAGSQTGFVLGRVAYNLGRVITYCLLGVTFGLIGKSLSLAGLQRSVSIALGVALLLGPFASRRVVVLRSVTVLVERLKSSMSTLLRRRSYTSLAALGLLNGLLPCGLVYVACAGAINTGEVLSGAKYMAAFGAGTVPMMFAISLFGKLVPISLRLKFQRAIPVSVFLLAVLLILRGMSLGIPYVSPDLANGADCCND